jgi:RNA polymerase sigma-70 factor (ECF subfamily)
MSEPTSWDLVGVARTGDALAREAFARRYLPAVRAYVVERWRGTRWIGECEDTVQEVFFECFRANGALQQLDRDRASSFRAFLYGVVCNLCRRVESRREPHEAASASGQAAGADEASEERLSVAFDRAWARALVRLAADRQAATARAAGPRALRRVELLRLRFDEGLSIRAVAERWQVDPDDLHHEYARARSEFQQALIEVVRAHHPGDPSAAARECAALLDLLG